MNNTIAPIPPTFDPLSSGLPPEFEKPSPPALNKEAMRIADLWGLPDSTPVRTHEAALMLRRSFRTLQNWRYKRVGPPYQLGTPVTYLVGDLRDYVKACTTRPR